MQRPAPAGPEMGRLLFFLKIVAHLILSTNCCVGISFLTLFLRLAIDSPYSNASQFAACVEESVQHTPSAWRAVCSCIPGQHPTADCRRVKRFMRVVKRSCVLAAVNGIIRTSVNLVMAPLTALDETNRVVTGVRQENFHLFEDKTSTTDQELLKRG